MNIKMHNPLSYSANIAAPDMPPVSVDVAYESSMAWLVSCSSIGLLVEFESLDLAFDYCRSLWVDSVIESLG